MSDPIPTDADATLDADSANVESVDSESVDSESVKGEHVAADSSDVVPPPLRIRYRIRFGKTGLLRWISHNDLARLWERLLRRAALKLSMTEGFHPKPRVAFPSALALGVESLDEVVEIELAELLTPSELLDRLRSDNQPGLTLKSVCQLPERFGKAQLLGSDYTISLVESVDTATIQQAIDRLMSQTTVSVERKKKTMTVKVAEQIERLELGDGLLQLSLAASDAASLKPADVLELLGFSDWIENGSLIRRVRVRLQKEFETEDSDLVAVSQQAEAELKQDLTRRDT